MPGTVTKCLESWLSVLLLCPPTISVRLRKCFIPRLTYSWIFRVVFGQEITNWPCITPFLPITPLPPTICFYHEILNLHAQIIDCIVYMTAYLLDVRHMLEEQVDNKIFFSPQDAGTRELLLMKLVNFHCLFILSNCKSKHKQLTMRVGKGGNLAASCID